MLEELPVFVDEPAAYESRDDTHIVARWKGRVFVIPVAIAKKSVALLNVALDRLHERRASKVVSLPPHR